MHKTTQLLHQPLSRFILVSALALTALVLLSTMRLFDFSPPQALMGADVENPWGVRVIGIRQSAAGYMLDFRFRVLDPQKAAALLDRRVKPVLIVEKNGVHLGVPVSAKIGALRQSAKFAKADKNYFMFFSNPGRKVKVGDRVSVVIGDFKTEQLLVQ